MSNPVEGAGVPGGVPGFGAYQLLWELVGTNMQLTTDQVMQQMFAGSTYDPQAVVGYWKSGAFNTSCLGGIYTGAGKTGITICAAGQSWAALTGANTHVNAAILVPSTTLTIPPIVSLSTGNAAALVADIRIYGFVVA